MICLNTRVPVQDCRYPAPESRNPFELHAHRPSRKAFVARYPLVVLRHPRWHVEPPQLCFRASALPAVGARPSRQLLAARGFGESRAAQPHGSHEKRRLVDLEGLSIMNRDGGRAQSTNELAGNRKAAGASGDNRRRCSEIATPGSARSRRQRKATQRRRREYSELDRIPNTHTARASEAGALRLSR
jgi:hypothetical protein